MKTPYITAHELVRLDKAIRILQIRFLGKRRQRVAKNVQSVARRLTTSSDLDEPSFDNSETAKPIHKMRSSSGKSTRAANKNSPPPTILNSSNGINRGDSPNDSTYDDTSYNDSTYNNDIDKNDKRKAKKKGTLMHKLGGLFSSDKDKEKEKAKEGKSRSQQNSPEPMENRSRSSSVASDR